MNEKGFGMTGVLLFAALGILAVFMFYTFVTSVIGSVFARESTGINYHNEYSRFTSASVITLNNTVSKYGDLERKLELDAISYINTNGESDANTSHISISVLKEQGYYYNDKLSSCTGYVTTRKTNGITSADAYINCEDGYMTLGYEKSLDK